MLKPISQSCNPWQSFHKMRLCILIASTTHFPVSIKLVLEILLDLSQTSCIIKLKSVLPQKETIKGFMTQSHNSSLAMHINWADERLWGWGQNTIISVVFTEEATPSCPDQRLWSRSEGSSLSSQTLHTHLHSIWDYLLNMPLFPTYRWSHNLNKAKQRSEGKLLPSCCSST